MINVGRAETRQLADRWTVCTKDGSRSAQFEHTLAVTNGEPEILTVL
jgi:methionyl aminopeptidase